MAEQRSFIVVLNDGRAVEEIHEPSRDEELTSDWIGYIIRLHSPIWSEELTGIIESDEIRVYPPFNMKLEGKTKGPFTIPSGQSEVNSWLPTTDDVMVVDSLFINFLNDPRWSNTHWYYNIRIDIKKSAILAEAIESVLALLRQFSDQWWIGKTRNPFNLGVRYCFGLNEAFEPIASKKTDGHDKPVVRLSAAMQCNQLIGIEAPFSCHKWQMVQVWLQQRVSADFGLSLWHDAVERYVAGDDRGTVLFLALMFEVCEKRYRKSVGMKLASTNKHLLIGSLFVPDELRATFKQILVDRDNVAHGSNMYHAPKNAELIERYINAGMALIRKYIITMNKYGWEKSAKL